jgi:hypothetical protein
MSEGKETVTKEERNRGERQGKKEDKGQGNSNRKAGGRKTEIKRKTEKS